MTTRNKCGLQFSFSPGFFAFLMVNFSIQDGFHADAGMVIAAAARVEDLTV